MDSPMIDVIAWVFAFAIAGIPLAICVMISRGINIRARKRDNPPLDILSQPFEQRALEASKIIQACLPLDLYEPDDEVFSIFSAQRQTDGRVLPGAYLWGKNDEILILPPDVIAMVYHLLAPGTHPRDYGPFELTYPRNPRIEDKLELSCNPHDLSQVDLERISRKYVMTIPRRSQLADFQIAPRFQSVDASLSNGRAETTS